MRKNDLVDFALDLTNLPRLPAFRSCHTGREISGRDGGMGDTKSRYRTVLSIPLESRRKSIPLSERISLRNSHKP